LFKGNLCNCPFSNAAQNDCFDHFPDGQCEPATASTEYCRGRFFVCPVTPSLIGVIHSGSDLAHLLITQISDLFVGKDSPQILAADVKGRMFVSFTTPREGLYQKQLKSKSGADMFYTLSRSFLLQ
jgi:hypothetical protein